MTTKNEPVGDSECPIKGCKESVQVFKYRSASEDSKRRRFAGRLYCVCPVHGRVENQEFLLENMKWHDGKSDTATDASTQPAPEPKPAPTQAAPSKPPATPAAAKRGSTAPSKAPTSKKQPSEQQTETKKTSWLPDYFK